MDQERLTPGLSVAPGCLMPMGGGHSAGTPCTQKMPLVPSSTQLPLLTASRTFLRHRHMGPHCPPRHSSAPALLEVPQALFSETPISAQQSGAPPTSVALPCLASELPSTPTGLQVHPTNTPRFLGFCKHDSGCEGRLVPVCAGRPRGASWFSPHKHPFYRQ